jgi:hypothetical protein
MHAKEHASMSIERSSNQGRLEDLFSRVSTPSPFSPDWHHQYGERLCAFPRYLVLPHTGVNLQFWPDLATFVEGPCWSVMMYYPGASRASVCILHWQGVPRWEAIRFDDEDVVGKAVAATYQELMEKIDTLTAV